MIGKSKYQNEKVVIFAPNWVKEGLRLLATKIPKGTQFTIFSGDESPTKHNLIIGNEINLKQLVAISRNEPSNCSGRINISNYDSSIFDQSVIYSIKDLVRQCVILGADKTTHYGGYPERKPIKQKDKVYIVDLAGLQFQKDFNSGRLVLIGKKIPQGFLDDFIYRNVVGEEKTSFEIAAQDNSGRYIKLNKEKYFDRLAYKKFVSYDLLLSGLALNEISSKYEINFKFLKYGTGYFAGSMEMRHLLSRLISEGVADGIGALLSHRPRWIKSIELPFYTHEEGIENVCKAHAVSCVFSSDDALKTTNRKLRTGTTNCGDPHTVLGNEMGYTSVDAAIGTNLKSNGHVFSPIINKLMNERFLDLTQIPKQKQAI